jgi:N-acetylmuramoyl-L-alanine amidase CwlA
LKEGNVKLDDVQRKLDLVQDYVPVGNSNRPGRKLVATSITIHNTDNDGPRANAAAHAKYMKGADARRRQVSWHFTVDDTSVYQSLPTTEIGWHTATGRGNNSSIGIEICMNPELDVKATYERAALLTAWLAYRLEFKIPSAVHQHNHWSGKDCPVILRHERNGWSWSKFLDLAKKYLDEIEPVDAATIRPPKNNHQTPEA